MSTYINPGTGKGFRVDRLETPPFLRDFLNHELAIRNLGHRTVNSYYLHIRGFLRWAMTRGHESVTADRLAEIDIRKCSLSNITCLEQGDIFEFLSFSNAEMGNGASTRSAKLTALKALYRYLNDMGLAAADPVINVKGPKKEKPMPKYLSLEESLVLLKSVDGENSERDYCIMVLFLNCGMRLSELVGINISNIREGTLKLYGKGRKERLVYLNEACELAIADYIKARNQYKKKIDKDALFISDRTGKRFSTRWVEEIVKRQFLKAGLSNKGYSPHKLRHTAASLMYQSGSASVLELKNILGHESTATTEIYTHLHQQQIKDALHNAPLARITRDSLEDPELTSSE